MDAQDAPRRAPTFRNLFARVLRWLSGESLQSEKPVASRAVIKGIQAGEMRFVGDIERRVDGVDAMRSPSTAYELFAGGVRFTIADYRPTEAMQANTTMSQVTTYLTIRYRPGIEGQIPGQLRLKHISDASVSPAIVDYYDIQGAIRDPSIRLGLLLSCVRRDSSGFRTGAIP